MNQFTDWYNHQHRHSRIHYVTPAQRHVGLDKAILETRIKTYEAAKEKHPQRWAGKTRDWSRQEVVTLNPDNKKITINKTSLKIAA